MSFMSDDDSEDSELRALSLQFHPFPQNTPGNGQDESSESINRLLIPELNGAPGTKLGSPRFKMRRRPREQVDHSCSMLADTADETMANYHLDPEEQARQQLMPGALMTSKISGLTPSTPQPRLLPAPPTTKSSGGPTKDTDTSQSASNRNPSVPLEITCTRVPLPLNLRADQQNPKEKPMAAAGVLIPNVVLAVQGAVRYDRAADCIVPTVYA